MPVPVAVTAVVMGAVAIVVIASLLFARWMLLHEDEQDAKALRDEAIRQSLPERRRLLLSLREKSHQIYIKEYGRTSDRAQQRMLQLDREIADLDDDRALEMAR